jgi:hypothetical protein
MLRILLFLSLAAGAGAATGGAVAAIPSVAAAAVAPGTDLSLLPLTLPGYQLRVLDQRKTLTYDAAGTAFEVRLPIFFYLPNAPEAQPLHLLRQAVDELRRAIHQPDRSEYDFEKLLARFEQGFSALTDR